MFEYINQLSSNETHFASNYMMKQFFSIKNKLQRREKWMKFERDKYQY